MDSTDSLTLVPNYAIWGMVFFSIVFFALFMLAWGMFKYVKSRHYWRNRGPG